MKPVDPKIVVLSSRRHAPVAPEPTATPGALAFDQSLGAHIDMLYATARVLCGDSATAEDLVQETALLAFRAWGQLRSPDTVKTWFLRILHRTFLNARRHDGRRPPIIDIDIAGLVDHPILGVEPDTLPGEGVLSEAVVTALDALPLGFREAVWLVDVEELKLAEAAEVLDVPVGTVASRVHRARRLLRESLAIRGKGGT